MNIRFPAHSGSFYPSHPSVLVEFILQLNNNFHHITNKSLGEFSRLVVLPHAGYLYSGGAAIGGFHYLLKNPNLKKVLVIGPAHYEGFTGFALSDYDGFETPLGILPIDKQSNETILKYNEAHFKINEQAHLQEHSIEVQIPLIQFFLKVESFVPILVGYNADTDVIADLIAYLLEANPDLAVIISSDLSHFLSYEGAIKKDSQTIQAIQDGNWEWLDGDCACGYKGIQGAMIYASKIGKKLKSVNYLNSGDITLDKTRVVGYSSFVMI